MPAFHHKVRRQVKPDHQGQMRFLAEQLGGAFGAAGRDAPGRQPLARRSELR